MSNNENLYYFQFNAQKWLSVNHKVQLLPMHVKGCFIDLIAMSLLNNGEVVNDEFLPSKLKQSQIEFSTCYDMLVNKFKIVQDNNGKLSIAFITNELNKIHNVSKQKKDAGRKGGKKKAINLSTVSTTCVAEPSTTLAEPSTTLAEPSTTLAEPKQKLAEPSTTLAEPKQKLAEPSTLLDNKKENKKENYKYNRELELEKEPVPELKKENVNTHVSVSLETVPAQESIPTITTPNFDDFFKEVNANYNKVDDCPEASPSVKPVEEKYFDYHFEIGTRKINIKINPILNTDEFKEYLDKHFTLVHTKFGYIRTDMALEVELEQLVRQHKYYKIILNLLMLSIKGESKNLYVTDYSKPIKPGYSKQIDDSGYTPDGERRPDGTIEPVL